MLSPNEDHQSLANITKSILDETVTVGPLRAILFELKDLFSKVSGIDKDHDAYEKDLHSITGKAVGPKWAELCVVDIVRTRKFIRGTYLAVKEKLATKENQPVTLLYVGTGPFATLVMPLTTIFKPEELQLILVEINPFTVDCLKQTIKNFGVEDYVKQIISEDAAHLQVNNPETIDILLLECLQNALVKEQQVAITYNILPQLDEKVILLPQEIKLDLCLINSKKQNDYMMGVDPKVDYYIEKNTIFLLNKEEVLKNKANNLQFPVFETALTQDDKRDFDKIAISTNICVFGEERCGVNQTSLTMMYRVNEIEKVKNYSSLTTQYQVSDVPGFEIKYL